MTIVFCDALGAITLARSSAYYFKNGEEYVIPSKDIFFRALVADGASSTFDASNFELNLSRLWQISSMETLRLPSCSRRELNSIFVQGG